jgi:hypothetical protein
MKDNRDMLVRDIIEARTVIREHRDAKGDDRCWITDYLVWGLLKYSPRLLQITKDEGMRLCELFYRHRRSETLDPIPIDAILDPTRWDDDLINNRGLELLEKQDQLVQYISEHCHIIGPRTIEHDRKLYSVLPEKLPADFRLPPREEFLGTAKDGAGCPNFWDSHTKCGLVCNLHQWGPCSAI